MSISFRLLGMHIIKIGERASIVVEYKRYRKEATGSGMNEENENTFVVPFS